MSLQLPALLAAPAAAVLLILAAAPTALAKEGVEARLETPLPLPGSPGQKVSVAWTLGYLDEEGNRRPFNAMGIFVRLLSASGGAPSMTFAGQGPLGHYVAEVTVPEGGVGGIEIGIRGTQCILGECAPSGGLFRLENGPLPTSPVAADPPREPDARGSFPTWLILISSLSLASMVALGALGAVLRRRFAASRQTQHGLKA